MAMWYKAMELKANRGHYRMCGYSDEQRHVFEELCSCEGGHLGEDGARDCEIAAARLAEIFPSKGKSDD